jgi:tetratricopeptide (TPR) repeat protein
MRTVTEIFAAALDHHRNGRLVEAGQLYRQVLAQDAGHAESLRLLGVIAAQGGEVDRAIGLFRRSLACAPGQPATLLNLGTALVGQGRAADAEACFRRALAVRPGLAEACFALALVLRDQGRLAEAETCFRQGLAGRPDDALARVSLGNLLCRQGRAAEAAACYRAALASRPECAEAYLNLGLLLLGLGLADEAAACCERAVALRPDLAVAHNGLGAAALAQGRLAAAEASLGQALALKPDFVDAHNNLGGVLQASGRPAEAAAQYRAALALRPDYALAHENLGMTLLALGDYVEGFREYEWRQPPPAPSVPPWDGGDPAGRTLLLVAEQGLGDTLQFIRYAPLVRARGARVIVACQPELVRLLASVSGIDRVVALGEPWPAADGWVALLSLPRLLGTTLDTVPAQVPYLAAGPRKVAAWAARLADCAGLKVGLVWAGNPYPDLPRGQAVDRRRSLALGQLAPLAAVAGVTLVSLQKGAAAAQAQSPPPGLSLFDPMAGIADFADTAALVSALDLVIGVDTAVIHLAGALARPVWVLSRFDACWRWLAGRETSPWYPTLRLFRQPAPGAWEPVVGQVVAALAAMTAKTS